MPASTASPARIAAAYFEAWKRNDIDQVRPLLHEDVDFVGALGTTEGVEQTLRGLEGMFEMTEQVDVVHRWVDGPDVLTWFELRTATPGRSRLSTGATLRVAASPESGSPSTRARCLSKRHAARPGQARG